MLTCVPQSIFNWNYRINGSVGGPATTELYALVEQGGVYCGGVQYQVVKHGWFSGNWTLENDRQVVAEASKDSPLWRTVTIQVDASTLSLVAPNPFTRDFQITANGTPWGTIEPDGIFTRAATIDCSDKLAEPIQLFCFWLVTMLWRRAANNNHH